MKVKFTNFVLPTDNIGDNAQVYAMEQIYKQMGLTNDNIVSFSLDSINELAEKSDVHYILPLITADIAYYDLINRLIECNLADRFSFIPLSLGQTRHTFVNEERLSKFTSVINRFVMPIGFRDYDSAEMYSNLGYQTYVNGCITNTYPKRPENGNYNKIYIIDVPKIFKQYIPEEILEKAVFLTNKIDVHIHWKEQYRICKERYDLLRDTAALVITCRYHIATPCNAMGIPVIMIENNNPIVSNWQFDQRMSALNPNIHFYIKEQWESIDWNPVSAYFEDEKKKMTDFVISRLKTAEATAYFSAEQNKFFSPSKERFWGIFCENRHKIDCFAFTGYLDSSFLLEKEKPFRYYCYGISNSANSKAIPEYVMRRYPESEFLGFVDSNKTGKYMGKEILSPDKMIIDKNTYCLVTAYSANKYVSELFADKGFDKSNLWLLPENILWYLYHMY